MVARLFTGVSIEICPHSYTYIIFNEPYIKLKQHTACIKTNTIQTKNIYRVPQLQTMNIFTSKREKKLKFFDHTRYTCV